MSLPACEVAPLRAAKSTTPARPVTVSSAALIPNTLSQLRRGDAVLFRGWCLELGGGVQGLDEAGQPITTRRVWATGPDGEFEAFRGWRGDEFQRLLALMAMPAT